MNRRRLIEILASALAAVTGNTAAAHAMAQAAGRSTAAPTLPFVDEAGKDPGFLAFRADLLQTIERRDVAALLQVVDPRIKNTFGDDNGIEAFKRLWQLDRPDSTLWPGLRRVLTLGGRFEGPDSFVAPYVFATWPDQYDPFDHVALVGDGVRIRSAPRPGAPVLATLSRSILKRDDTFNDANWIGVALPDGRSGFVSSELARMAVDHRAYFARSNGRWVMVVLIAGD